MGRIEIIHNRPTEQRGDWRHILPGVVISGIAIGVLIFLADLELFIGALRLADYRMVLAAMFLTLVWLAVRGIVWLLLLEGQATYRQVFITINEGYLLNNLLPFRLGELGRAYLLGRKAGLNFWRVLSSIVVERSLDLAIAAGLLLITLPFVVGARWAQQAAFGVGIITFLILVGLYLVAHNTDRAIPWFQRLADRWALLSRLGGKAVPAFIGGLGVFTEPRRFLLVVGMMLINWLVAVGQYYAFLAAFFPHPRLLWAGFGLGVVALGIAAPSSPGAVGVLELSLVGALAVFGLLPSISLAAAVTIHLTGYLIAGTIGAYGLARDGESLWGLYRNLRQMNVSERE
ncbi:MAG: lysylphosphatidylglycerol synthase transmembrane domain-containing protein [Anaerolineales bacterium]|nr:lysylphosphatidylglycerol synthase transmembrane domain-containing protein [Anaerolineales bacterium]